MGQAENRRDDVDPEIRTFVTEVTRAYALYGMGRAENYATRRRIAEQVRAPWAANGPKMYETQTLRLKEARVRIYRPTATPSAGTMIYLHGGGWVLFSIDTHDRLMREYAARSGLTVVGIDYALAPEHRFPVALDQIAAIIATLRANQAQFGLDLSRLALAGDSVGAHLALVSALRLRDAGAPAQALLLNYGAFDQEQRPSHQRYDGPDYMLTAEEMAGFWAQYLAGHLGNTRDSRPLHANLTGLPPTHLCIAECDILADENRELATRLKAAGVTVEAHVFEGATHSFLEAVSISCLANRALQMGSDWLRTELAAAKITEAANHG